MSSRAARGTAVLARLGVKPGDRVATCSDNRPEFLDFMFGLARCGAVQVPINPAYRGWQIATYSQDVDARLAIVETAHFGELVAAIEEGAPLRTILVVDGTPANSPVVDVEVVRLEELAGDHDEIDMPQPITPLASDPYVIMATSGTTSASKGVVLCHEHEYRLASNFIEALRFTENDVFYNYFPLFHNTAQGIITWGVLLKGASMVLRPKYSQSQFWTTFSSTGVPTSSLWARSWSSSSETIVPWQ